MKVDPSNRFTGADSNHLMLHRSKAIVVSNKEKAQKKMCQMSIKEMNESEPPVRCRNEHNDVKIRTTVRGLR